MYTVFIVFGEYCLCTLTTFLVEPLVLRLATLVASLLALPAVFELLVLCQIQISIQIRF